MTTITYEKETCSRCNGSGSYSWCQRFGSTCFKCQGNGKQLTRRGKAAMKKVRQFLTDNYSTAVEDLTPGTKIKDSDGTYRTVEKVKTSGCVSIAKDGTHTNYIDVVTPKITIAVFPGHLFQCRPSVDQFNKELVPFARRFKGATINE